jgi:hypothetical protein
MMRNLITFHSSLVRATTNLYFLRYWENARATFKLLSRSCLLSKKIKTTFYFKLNNEGTNLHHYNFDFAGERRTATKNIIFSTWQKKQFSARSLFSQKTRAKYHQELQKIKPCSVLFSSIYKTTRSNKSFCRYLRITKWRAPVTV